MGIYTNGKVYGIRIINEEGKIIYEIIDDKLEEAKLFYTQLDNKKNLLFFSYNEFSTTYGEGVYKSWLKISLDTFLEIIGIHITT
jgi:hypothetical protein